MSFMRRLSWHNVCGQPAGAIASVSFARHIAWLLYGVGVVLATAFLCLLLAGASPLSAYADEGDAQVQEAVEDLEEAFADAYDEAQNEEAETADMASSKSDDAAATNSGGKGTLAKGGAPMKENPYTSPMHDLAFVLLGIMISTSAFFFVVNGRLKKSIEKMRHFVD